MKRKSVLFTIFLIFFLVFGNNAISARNRPEYVPGEVLIKYKSSVSASSIKESQAQFGIMTIRKFKYIGVRHVKLPTDLSVEDALEIYRNDPNVEYAEPNYYRYATSTTPPDDTYFENLWGLNNTGQSVNGTSGTADADIDAPEAWDIATGSSDIIIAVIDSGVDYNHQDLSVNIWSNTGEIADNGIDDDGNGYVDDVRGWDFVNGDNDPIDSNDHGTHVAGTIAAKGNNTTGIMGVCWTAKIMPLRFLNAFGSGSSADAISAINYARGNGAKIINASYGSIDYSQSEKDAISIAGSAGILFVAAAGNDGTDNDTTHHYPSDYDLSNMISVTATDQDDALCSFSNYGAVSVDVGAPGENIYSTRPARQTVWSDNFDDGDMSDWATGGTKNTWGLSNSVSYSSSYSLTDSPAGDYQNDTDSWARAPVLDLSSHSGSKLGFKLRGVSELGYDGLRVQASTDGSIWSSQAILIGNDIYTGISGTLGSWSSAYVDLGAYDGNSTVHIRFRFTSDVNTVRDGWYIDDVAVTAASSSYPGTEYQYMSGTSMAAPHVAGLAGLIWGNNSGLAMTEVKDIILNSVDSKDSLTDKTTTGGRINAFNALPPLAPGGLAATTASSSQIDLSWTDNSSNETGFKIERKTGSGGTYAQIATVSADVTSYSSTGLSEATTYYYRVRAYNSAGNSNYSNDSNATTCPAAPSGLSATTASSSQIDLSWTDNSSGESGFKIERKTGSGGTYAQIVTVSADVTSYSSTGLTASTTYYYHVRAHNSGGNSSYSSEANATTSATSGRSSGGGGGGGCFITTVAP